MVRRVMTPFAQFGQPECDICGERLRPDDAVAEMYDLSRNHKSVVCHAECGTVMGLEIAPSAADGARLRVSAAR